MKVLGIQKCGFCEVRSTLEEFLMTVAVETVNFLLFCILLLFSFSSKEVEGRFLVWEILVIFAERWRLLFLDLNGNLVSDSVMGTSI